MEPIKALTLVAAAGVVSLAGMSAAGFYLGYSAGRSLTDDFKRQTETASAPVGPGNANLPNLSLKPVLEDIRALSKQVETLAANVKPGVPASDNSQSQKVLDEVRGLSKQIEAVKVAAAQQPNAARPQPQPDLSGITKAVADEVRSLSRQIETLRNASANGQAQTAAAPQPRDVPDYRENLDAIEEQVKALSAKIDKQEQKGGKPVADEIRALAATLQNQEAKAPKGLIEEVRAIAASVQAQEPYGRRAIIDEIKAAVTTLQNQEPKAPKALIEEIRAIANSAKPGDPRPQPAVIDQIKVLNASVEQLRQRMPDGLADEMKRISQQVQALADRQQQPERGRPADAGMTAEIGQLKQLVANASEQFGRCQTQLASLSTASFTPAQPAPAATTVQPRGEATSVVFYDNVMLRKDQEKQYDEIGVKLSLQSVSSRQVRLAINRQGIGLAFGERKVFRSQDVECEMNLMETNLSDGQARVSISCKR
jgi:hypothetical protein